MQEAPKNKQAKNGNGNGHRFNGEPGPGRKRGVPNRMTTALKEAILLAASNVGDEVAQARIDRALGDGELIEANGGLVGYLEMVARGDPRSFMSILGKVLPLVVKGEIDVNVMDEAQRNAEHFTRQLQRLSGRVN